MRDVLPRPQAAALVDAQSGLKEFRRGWAKDRNGPFHSRPSIAALLARGLVRFSAGRYRLLATEAAAAHLADRLAP